MQREQLEQSLQWDWVWQVKEEQGGQFPGVEAVAGGVGVLRWVEGSRGKEIDYAQFYKSL